MSDKTIVIYDESGNETQAMFPAPADKYAALSLWVFLVDNLQPGFIVELQIGDNLSAITRASGQKVTPELYHALMEDTYT